MKKGIWKLGLHLSVILLVAGIVFTAPAFAARPVTHEIVVSKDNDGDFNTITEALNSIADASAANPYRITVKPGVYSEAVTMKSYVDIVGSGQENTTITYNGSNDTITWPNSSQSTLENLTVTITPAGIWGDNLIYIRNDARAIIRNVKILSDGSVNQYGSVNEGIRTRSGSELQIFNSEIILASGQWQPSFGINFHGNSLLVSGCLIELSGVAGSWDLGIASEGITGTIINTTVKIKSQNGGYGITGSNTEIMNSNVSVETVTDSYGSYGIVGTGNRIYNSIIASSTETNPVDTVGVDGYSDTTIINSTVSGTVYGYKAGSGYNNINNSVVSGGTLGIYKGGTFKIGASQIEGGHNGVGGVDKVVNCHDGNFNPLPDL